jgi:SH3-like domain-containing protein
MRVGPGEDYRINWVYTRQHLPLKVLRAMEGWRLVEDPDGARGWILAKFVSKEREGYVTGKQPAAMHQTPDAGSKLLWQLAPGVVGKLGDCDDSWCKIEIAGRGGFVREASLWGTAKLKD